MRFVARRPYFLFAFESRLTGATVRQRIMAWNTKNNMDVSLQIDAVYILDKENIVNFGNGDGMLQYITADGELRPGYVVQQGAQFPTLVSFLGWASATMPRLNLPKLPILAYLGIPKLVDTQQSSEK